jgi:hypothetical protein
VRDVITSITAVGQTGGVPPLPVLAFYRQRHFAPPETGKDLARAICVAALFPMAVVASILCEASRFRFILGGQRQLAREQSVLHAVSAGSYAFPLCSWAGAALGITPIGVYLLLGTHFLLLCIC